MVTRAISALGYTKSYNAMASIYKPLCVPICVMSVPSSGFGCLEQFDGSLKPSMDNWQYASILNEFVPEISGT